MEGSVMHGVLERDAFADITNVDEHPRDVGILEPRRHHSLDAEQTAVRLAQVPPDQLPEAGLRFRPLDEGIESLDVLRIQELAEVVAHHVAHAPARAGHHGPCLRPRRGALGHVLAD